MVEKRISNKQERVKVAIIDSGIDINNSILREYIIGGVSLEYDGSKDIVCVNSNYNDDNGHGTLCASVIKSQYPNAGLFIVKVLNRNALATSRTLIKGLEFLLNTDIRIINLSIAILKYPYLDEINEIFKSLYNEGKIAICSLANGFEISYPAKLPHVIGVGGRRFNSRDIYWYNSEYPIQCVADNTRMLSCSANNSFRLFGKCNSKATALLTGKIAGILANNPDISFEQLEEILVERASKNIWTKSCLENKERELVEFDKEKYTRNPDIMAIIINIIREIFGIKEDKKDLLYNTSLYHPFIGVNEYNCYEIIRRIENEFGINLDYNSISSATFSSIYTLADLIINRKEKRIETC